MENEPPSSPDRPRIWAYRRQWNNFDLISALFIFNDGRSKWQIIREHRAYVKDYREYRKRVLEEEQEESVRLRSGESERSGSADAVENASSDTD